MTRLEPADTIEKTVGATRHATDHIARAISAEQRVYILHPDSCLERGIDLRSCEYSIALDLPLDLDVWEQRQDTPVRVAIDVDEGDLVPADSVSTESFTIDTDTGAQP